MSYGSEGRDGWITGRSIPEALSQHRTCGAEDGEHHKRLQKSLRSSGHTRWASTALRWGGHMSLPDYDSVTLAVSHLGWIRVKSAPLQEGARLRGCRHLPNFGVHLTVLALSRSVTCPGLRGCLSGKEEWQEMWHKFNSELNFPSHSAGKNNLYKLQGKRQKE